MEKDNRAEEMLIPETKRKQNDEKVAETSLCTK